MTDLFVDLADGINLIMVLNAVVGDGKVEKMVGPKFFSPPSADGLSWCWQRIPNKPGKRKLMRIHMIENVDRALRFIKDHDVSQPFVALCFRG